MTAVRMVTAAILAAQAKALVASGYMTDGERSDLEKLLEAPEVTLAHRVILPALTHAGRELMSRMPEFCQESWR